MRKNRLLGRILAEELSGDELRLASAMYLQQDPEPDYTSVTDPKTGEEIG